MITVPGVFALPPVEVSEIDSRIAGRPTGGNSVGAHGAIARLWRLRRLRLWAMGGFILFCTLGALQSRVGSTQPQNRPDTERMKALTQASALLMSPPVDADAVSLRARVPIDTFAPGTSEAISSGERGFVGAGVASAQFKRPLLSVSKPAAVTQSELGPSLSFQPSAAVTTGDPVNNRRLPMLATGASIPEFSSHTRFLHHEIPVSIEGLPSLPEGGDGLAGIVVHASLRVLDGNNSPFRLLATRLDNGSARAQLQEHDATGRVLASNGWLAAGDSPAPGWQVLKVTPASVLLLTPFGNPLRLYLAMGLRAQ